MSVSLVIPTYTLSPALGDMAYNCIISMSDQVDEIIVSEDGGQSDASLMELADIYMLFTKNIGFTGNVNRGWRVATGDFVIIANSDTKLLEGNLKDLCIPGKVTSPNVVNHENGGLTGSFFVVPREVQMERGMLNEDMKNYYSDEDYSRRTKDIFQKVNSVKVHHHMAQTVKAAGVEGDNKEDGHAYRKLYENR